MSAGWHYFLFAAIVVIATAVTMRRLRALGFSAVNRRIGLLILVVTVLPGGLLIHRAEVDERARLVRTVEGFAPVYARETERLGHARLSLDTPEDDPTFLELIETQKRWLGANPRVADIYTFKLLDASRVVLWVDAETDYDGNGIYEGDRESRTVLGEPYDDEDVSDELRLAFQGVPGFEAGLVSDRWGVWVSAYEPLRDAQGRVEAVLGIDFPAEDWVAALATAREQRALQLLVSLGLILASTLIIAQLNARLSSAQRHEQALRHSVEIAQYSDRAKSEFLANMSHEMRTPLNGILGVADLLMDTELDARQRDYVATTRTSAACLLELVSNVLDLSKIEEGKLVLERVPYAVRTVVGDVGSVLRSTTMQRSIAVVVEVANDVPESLIGDPTRLKQVLLNLGGNAVKFTERGSVELAVRRDPAASDGDALLIHVRDTGVGIPEDKLELIFEKFTQADASTTRRFGGSGLGLAITRELVQAMNGRITVTSTVGVGSEFEVRLPLEAAPSLPSPNVAPPGSTTTLPVGLRVLLVEDNSVNRMVMEATLARLECVVVAAEHGAAAVECLAREAFDVVLMDCQMPVMDGYEATRQIRASGGPSRNVRIVALTANALEGDRERCLAAGMDDYLSKPVMRGALLEALERAVAEHRTAA
ncbi:MAG: ATP-binding protein [Planctomycetes bacterium]|nr:ATP-binding protein [Planctomycetota bacterium]